MAASGGGVAAQKEGVAAQSEKAKLRRRRR